MSAVPQEALSSFSAVVMTLCPQCGQENPSEETYCIACGAALAGDPADPPLAPLAAGTVVADLYLIETVESYARENRYHAVRQDEGGGQVLLRERVSEEAEPLRTLADRTAGLSHPALLVPERLVEQDGRVYLVCPEVASIKLTDRLGLTAEREAVAWGVQLCQIVKFLHRRDLLCVELPPEAVVLDKEGRIRLTQLKTLTAKGIAHENGVVTDGYAAPEVYKPGELSEQADIFAIGALLYTLVVGKRLPVEGWVVHPEAPTFYPEKVVSPACERVLRRALAFEPKDRYEDVDALKAALLALNQTSRVRAAWLTDVGQVRSHNEDAVLVKEWGQGTVTGNEFSGLYVVSDGMGGAAAGEVASTITIQTVVRYVEQAWAEGGTRDAAAWEACLREAIAAANTAILAYAKEHPESTGLGATVVAALVQAQQLTLAWVGDSRAYLWEHGELQQLSRDHSLVARLVEIGQLTAAEARTHEHRNVLIRSLGSKDQVVADAVSRPLRRGARLVLCSDGLTSHVEDNALADIVSRHREPGDAALELVVAANGGGGSDNISVVVVFHE
ncbi:MAG TPA: Stp1/IreP family PP2C-type Ser/Thr phosphatase [Candidatus Binatia bacterium]|jgi:protein phosphatase|nr:Stp1/IreP family PP2C-type Ser/Thr phosphatase [Candidatus Binatia bacterium]